MNQLLGHLLYPLLRRVRVGDSVMRLTLACAGLAVAFLVVVTVVVRVRG